MFRDLRNLSITIDSGRSGHLFGTINMTKGRLLGI